MPIRIVECDRFRDLLSLIEPWYKMASHNHILLLLNTGVNNGAMVAIINSGRSKDT